MDPVLASPDPGSGAPAGGGALRPDPRALARTITARTVAANGVGAALVFALLRFGDGQPALLGPDDVISLTVLVTYLAVVAVGVSVLSQRTFQPIVTWLDGGRDEPGRAERRVVLLTPGRLALLTLLGWGGATAIFSPLQLALGNGGRESVRIGGGIALGGLVVALLTFLLVEEALRPLLALVLQAAPLERPATLGIRTRLVLAWALGSGVPLLGVALSTVIHRAGGDARVLLVAIVALGLVTGGRITWATASTLTAPLDRLRAAVRAVEAGDLEARSPVDDAGEIGMLQAGFNRMVEGLGERERLQELFGRHVGVEVARRELERGAGLGGEQREASVLFVDLVGSTGLATRVPPDRVVELLNRMFAVVARVVDEEGGLIDKFEGDGALCLFGAPADLADHTGAALRAARRLRAELAAAAATHPALDVGIAVSSGPVVAGTVGSPSRYEYTVIGDPVNEAARLVDLAKRRSERVLASEAAVDAAADSERAHWHCVGELALRGRPHPTKAYEPREP